MLHFLAVFRAVQVWLLQNWFSYLLQESLRVRCSQGNIAVWRKKEGDEVSAGDVLCEIETVGLVVTSLRDS